MVSCGIMVRYHYPLRRSNTRRIAIGKASLYDSCAAHCVRHLAQERSMRNPFRGKYFWLIPALLAAMPLWAHHSISAEFDTSRVVHCDRDAYKISNG